MQVLHVKQNAAMAVVIENFSNCPYMLLHVVDLVHCIIVASVCIRIWVVTTFEHRSELTFCHSMHTSNMHLSYACSVVREPVDNNEDAVSPHTVCFDIDGSDKSESAAANEAFESKLFLQLMNSDGQVYQRLDQDS